MIIRAGQYILGGEVIERNGKYNYCPISDNGTALRQILRYYPQRDRGIISERVEACILKRQKKL